MNFPRETLNIYWFQLLKNASDLSFITVCEESLGFGLFVVQTKKIKLSF